MSKTDLITDREIIQMLNNAEDEVAGLLSGFPDCCIEFFIDVWKKHHTFRKMITVPDHWIFSYSNLVHEQRWGYIPCPECLNTGIDKRLETPFWKLSTDEVHLVAHEVVAAVVLDTLNRVKAKA